jgi:hypothetical protein
MFDMSGEETTQLAEANDLQRILQLDAKSVQQANRLVGLTWTHLARLSQLGLGAAKKLRNINEGTVEVSTTWVVARCARFGLER